MPGQRKPIFLTNIKHIRMETYTCITGTISRVDNLYKKNLHNLYFLYWPGLVFSQNFTLFIRIAHFWSVP
jgi:hypothetical protein